MAGEGMPLLAAGLAMPARAAGLGIPLRADGLFKVEEGTPGVPVPNFLEPLAGDPAVDEKRRLTGKCPVETGVERPGVEAPVRPGVKGLDIGCGLLGRTCGDATFCLRLERPGVMVAAWLGEELAGEDTIFSLKTTPRPGVFGPATGRLSTGGCLRDGLLAGLGLVRTPRPTPMTASLLTEPIARPDASL